MTEDDAGKPIYDGTEMCSCGHRLDDHGGLGNSCWYGGCACLEFDETAPGPDAEGLME